MAFKPHNVVKKKSDFKNEYSKVGYMQNNKETSAKEDTCFYLPHCFVFKDAVTTKCIPSVFPGSVNSPTRVSQNDILHTGPTTHFFTHQVRFSANNKMHQQIMIHPNSLAVLTS